MRGMGSDRSVGVASHQSHVGWLEFNVLFHHKYGYIRDDPIPREVDSYIVSTHSHRPTHKLHLSNCNFGKEYELESRLFRYLRCCCMCLDTFGLLWPLYGIGQAIIFLLLLLLLLLFLLLFSSPSLCGWRLDVYHTSAHGVALVQI